MTDWHEGYWGQTESLRAVAPMHVREGAAEPWRPVFLFFPRRSVTGHWLWGRGEGRKYHAAYWFNNCPSWWEYRPRGTGQ